MTTLTQEQMLRDLMATDLTDAEIDGWTFNADDQSGAWSWTKGPVMIWATPWWEGCNGIPVHVEVYGEPQKDYENGFEARFAGPTLKDTCSPYPNEVQAVKWYLSEMRKFFKTCTVFS